MIRCVAFDFDGVFTDNAVYVLQDGTEMVRCTRADGLGLQQLRAKGLKLVVISTEKNPVVGARCAKLGLECLQDSSDKVRSLEGFLKHLGISFEETAFLGNDINDSDLLAAVGFPAVVADAHPDVIPLAKHRTSRARRTWRGPRIQRVPPVLRPFGKGPAMSPLFSVQDKTIVITGGLGQLGLAYAGCLAAQNARVALLDIATTPSLPGILLQIQTCVISPPTSPNALRLKRRSPPSRPFGVRRTASSTTPASILRLEVLPKKMDPSKHIRRNRGTK